MSPLILNEFALGIPTFTFAFDFLLHCAIDELFKRLNLKKQNKKKFEI